MTNKVAEQQISFIEDLGEQVRSRLTPMMKQYLEIKEAHQDCILFFRLGDFYEMFFDDALEASKVLEITLTKKNCGIDGNRAPMCGVPFHSAETYIARLVEKGYKVAICEQTEDPGIAIGLVSREVVRIVTPGTLTGDLMLKAEENNFLASVYVGKDGIGLTWADISTGDICAAELDVSKPDTLMNELMRIAPSELLFFDENAISLIGEAIEEAIDIPRTELPSSEYTQETGMRLLRHTMKIENPKSLGFDEESCTMYALFGLVSYLDKTQKRQITHMKPILSYNFTDHMRLDRASIRNLELTESILGKDTDGSLLAVLDKTHTAMGGRLLKKLIKEPLIQTDAIQKRLSAVEFLYEDVLIRNNIKTHLKAIYDLERLVSRVSSGNANGRDLIALKNSVLVLPEIKNDLEVAEDSLLLLELNDRIANLEEIYALIDAAIVEEPPFTVREGGLIKSGYAEGLDDLKSSIASGQEWIANLENSERIRTGIKTLKVGYNKVFGYYIDITNSNRNLVPPEYIRKQTLVNSERYVTQELREVESKVLTAETRINQLEYDLFIGVRERLTEFVTRLQQTADALAHLDVLASFAEVAEKQGYSKPDVDDGDVIRIEKGRHPVIEKNLRQTSFVPNDVYIDRGAQRMLLITGPNMAGKSTYMRMTALIVLMAQIGSFVPADRARIGIADRLYTRIGASDNLTKGESTFYVEMNELAYILNTATEKSLIILDEIGRGTSTYDGLSIAWAVLEYLCSVEHCVRTLFATHYHELTTLENELPGLVNLHTEIAETDGNIVFLHRISSGSAERSYGIHVAKLAGVPEVVLDSASMKLSQLEEERMRYDAKQLMQTSLFSETDEQTAKEDRQNGKEASIVKTRLASYERISDVLRTMNLMEMTPAKAISILEELQRTACEEDA